jgi:hypothetical protein
MERRVLIPLLTTVALIFLFVYSNHSLLFDNCISNYKNCRAQGGSITCTSDIEQCMCDREPSGRDRSREIDAYINEYEQCLIARPGTRESCRGLLLGICVYH